MKKFHVPVMPEEVLNYLSLRKGQVVFDLTLGGGGYAELVLPLIGKEGKLVGVDWDEEILEAAREKLKEYQNVVFVKENFKNLEKIKQVSGAEKANAVLLDLGTSFFKLTSPGMSFAIDAPLDMRMDKSLPLTAADLVNRLNKNELSKLLLEYGDEPAAFKIAGKIVEQRKRKPIETTFELVEIIKYALPPQRRRGPVHFATRTFQALRIAVNEELLNLSEVLPQAADLLADEGRLVCLSYHSGEDRIVKKALLNLSGKCVCGNPDCCTCAPIAQLKILTKKPVTANREEIRRNPSARSAKLRAAEKISGGKTK